MVELASHILDTKAAHFDPSKFSDDYENALKALVRRKASGKTIKVSEREEKPDNVINLMDALKASLKGKGAAKRRTHATASRRTPARRAARKAHRSAARTRKAG
jgi:non-homologous end joining protein Ku